MNCQICNKPISGKYYIDNWGHKVCASHIDNGEMTYCSTCTAFANKNNILQDRRVLCNNCTCSAVKIGDNINTVSESVISEIHKIGFDDLHIDSLSIKVVDATYMANLRGGVIDTKNKGITQSEVSTSYSLFGLNQKSMTHIIYMLDNQPQLEFIGTLAHELLHAWQVQNSITPEPKYCEGFCNMATYHILNSSNEKLAEILVENMMQNPDPIYGDGFREVFSVWQQIGWEKLIERYRNNDYSFKNLKSKKAMANEQRFAGESAQNFEQKCMCVLVLDASGSMRGDKLTSLNNGIKDFFSQIQNSDGVAESTKDQLEVAIIQYDEEVEILRDPQLIDDEESAPEVTERGSVTETAAALKEAIQLVEDRKAFYKSTGQTYYRPWIILMTDGEPTSNQAEIDAITAQISTDVDSKKYMVMGIGVGNDVDINRLQLMTGKAQKLAGLKFGEFFQWLSASMSTITQSKSGEKVDISQGASDWMAGFDI